MKSYTYKGHTFRATDTTTTVHIKREGDSCYREATRPLYEIDDLKDRGTRPFLTTIKEVREYIDDAQEDTIITNNRETERVYWGEDNGDGEYLFVLDANDKMIWAAGYVERDNQLRDLTEYMMTDSDIAGWAYGYLSDLDEAQTTLAELRESNECRVVYLGQRGEDLVGKLREVFA